MRIESRFVCDGENCYNIDDDGYKSIASERGLYEEATIKALTESGYKFYDYHGNIVTPEGIRIQELVEVPCTAQVNEIQVMKDVAEGFVLSESEATVYFSRDIQIESITMREPVDLQIKTREELVAYLQRVARVGRFSNADVRPLNSFVAKEALFTLDELSSDSEIRQLYNAVESRRVFNSLQDYNKLIKFLQEQGVLGDKYELVDVVKAYMSWGVCGINATVTNIYTKPDIYADITSVRDAADMTNKMAGCLGETALIDSDGTVYGTSAVARGWDEDVNPDFNSIRPLNEDLTDYSRKLRRSSKWTAKYETLEVIARSKRDRLYIEMVNENGAKVTAKFDPSRYAIVGSNGVIKFGSLFYIRALDDAPTPIELVSNSADMTIYNLCLSQARDLVKQHTVKPPVSSTVEMLQQEGLSTLSAAKYIAKRIEADGQSVDYSLSRAWYYYMTGPHEETIKLFNPEGIEYSNLDELIDIMADTRDAMAEEGTYPPVASKDGKGSLTPDFNVLDMPIEQLEFVREVKNGNKTIGNMQQGRTYDRQTRAEKIAKLFAIVVRKECEGSEVNYMDIQRVLKGIMSGELLDVDSLVSQIDGEYMGYLKDRAVLNANRANTASSFVWVTRVFRELSNQKIEDQRHYAFECIAFPIAKHNKKENEMHSALTVAITNAINDGVKLERRYKEILLMEAPSYAARLIFKLILKQAKYEVQEGLVNIHETMSTGKGNEIQLKIAVPQREIASLLDGTYLGPEYIKYCTLSDWCQYEIDANLRFNFYALNACITPWYVRPKKGMTIYSYNYAINYLSSAVLQSALPSQLIDTIKDNNAKVSSIKVNWFEHELIETDFETKMQKYDESTIEGTLAYESVENFNNYYDRWTFAKKAVKATGEDETLIRVPLRSDIIFENYALPGDKIVTDRMETIRGAEKRVGSFALTQVGVESLSESSANNRAITGGNTITQFDVQDYGYEDIERWVDLVSGQYECKGMCYCTGPILSVIVDGGKTKQVDLRIASISEMEELEQLNVAYRLSATKFYIKTNNQIVVEVK